MDKGPEWRFFQRNCPKGQQVYKRMLNITCICCCSVTQPCLTLCNPMDPYQTSLSLTVSWSLPKSWSSRRWCCPAISSSSAIFSFCHPSFPASGAFQMSHLFSSDDQNTGASPSASVLKVNIQVWSPLRLTGLISLYLGKCKLKPQWDIT